MKNILNNNDLNLDEINAHTINTSNLIINENFTTNCPLTIISSSIGNTYTPNEIMNGVIERTATSVGSAITDYLPSASSFKSSFPELKTGDMISCIFRINNASGQTFNLDAGAGGTLKSYLGTTNAHRVYVDGKILFTDNNGNYNFYKMLFGNAQFA